MKQARKSRGSDAGTEPQARPVTAVHVVAPAAYGGLERVVEGLACGLRANGHPVHILAVVGPDDTSHPFVSRARDCGIPVTVVTVGGREYLREMREIESHCRRLGAQLIHTHGYRPDILASRIARRLRIPRVSTVHGFTGGDWKNRLYERLQLRSYRGFEGVIAVSRPLQTLLQTRGVPSGRLHLVPNAWQESPLLSSEEARTGLGVPRDVFHLGWVGRLSVEKGPDQLIEAVARLRDLPLIVSIIGDGPERRVLEARANELGVAEIVRWQGSFSHAGRYFPGFDGFVLSSRTEGTPMVLLEAMAAGTPIVAMAVGGVPDVIGPGEGELVAPGDLDGLADAIRRIQTEPEAARRKAEQARDRLVARYSFAAWIKAYENIYGTLVYPNHH